MYIWKIKPIIKELAERKMSEWSMVQYLIASVVLITIVGDYTNILNREPVFGLRTIIYILVGILGVYYCYSVNRKIDNQDFIIRFIILCWPVGLRMAIAFYIGLLLVYQIYFFFQMSHDSVSTELLFEGYGLMYEVASYYVLSIFISKVGKSAKNI